MSLWESMTHLLQLVTIEFFHVLLPIVAFAASELLPRDGHLLDEGR